MPIVRPRQEKKRLSYERYHRVRGGENDKAFRKKWPVKKRKASRAFRHAADVMTRSAVTDEDADIDMRLIKQSCLEKWGVQNLAQIVSSAFESRKQHAGARKRRREARKQYS